MISRLLLCTLIATFSWQVPCFAQYEPDTSLNYETFLGQCMEFSDAPREEVWVVNFWATWCRPCMRKMVLIKKIQKELEQQDIVFIHVSLDRNESLWRNTLSEKAFGGIQVLAVGELNSEIAKAYEVKVLPQFFIIDKKGEFVKNPKTSAVEDLKSKLEETAIR